MATAYYCDEIMRKRDVLGTYIVLTPQGKKNCNLNCNLKVNRYLRITIISITFNVIYIYIVYYAIHEKAHLLLFL